MNTVILLYGIFLMNIGFWTLIIIIAGFLYKNMQKPAEEADEITPAELFNSFIDQVNTGFDSVVKTIRETSLAIGEAIDQKFEVLGEELPKQFPAILAQEDIQGTIAGATVMGLNYMLNDEEGKEIRAGLENLMRTQVIEVMNEAVPQMFQALTGVQPQDPEQRQETSEQAKAMAGEITMKAIEESLPAPVRMALLKWKPNIGKEIQANPELAMELFGYLKNYGIMDMIEGLGKGSGRVVGKPTSSKSVGATW